MLGRFINADGYASTGQGFLGYNMFAYCGNCPIVFCDSLGTRRRNYDDPNDDGGDCFCPGGIDGSNTGTADGGGATSTDKVPHFDRKLKELIESELQCCADAANEAVLGDGPVAGTYKHTAFKNLVDSLGIDSLQTEISYSNGNYATYGTAGSIRFDVLLFDEGGSPVAAWDFKTGTAILTPSRIQRMITNSGLDIYIFEIR